MKITFIKHGNYFYKVSDIWHKKAYTRKNCKTCGKSKMMQTRATAQFCSKECSKLGAENPQWKGNNAGYLAKHGRVYRLRGKATFCVWECNSKTYEWANLTGNYSDPWDYASMCSSCHRKFDGSVEKCSDTICDRGHSFEKDGYYSRITKNGEARQCKKCAKDRALGKI